MWKRWCLVVVAVVAVDARPARAELGEKWDMPTVGLQGLASAGGILAVAGVAKLALDKPCEGWDCYDFAPVLLTVIAGFGVSVAGTQLTGYALDGTGSLKGTLAGTGVGIAAGIGGLILTSKLDDDPPAALAVSVFFVPMIAGGVIGYHVSSDDKPGTVMRIALYAGSF